MTRTILPVVLSVLFCCLGLFISDADAKKPPELVIADSTQIQMLNLQDGSFLIGRITDILNDAVLFTTEYGSLRISKTEIEKIKTFTANKHSDGVYYIENPNYTRLFFAPTGRMLKKKEGYFADYYIFFPTAVYGISNKVTMGLGMSIFPGGNLSEQLYYATPKFSLKETEKYAVSAGVLAIKIPNFGEESDTLSGTSDSDDSPSTFGILYTVGTYGGPDRSLTFGLGYGFVDDKLADRPIVVLGGEYRLSNRIALVSENWAIPGTDGGIMIYGLRFIGMKMCVDFAFLTPVGAEQTVAIPYIDFVVNF